jgi:GTPase-activating protein SAC7
MIKSLLTELIKRSITQDCALLERKVGSALGTLAKFVRHVREARADADTVSRDLHSLQNVLGLLKEDAELFPPELAEKTLSIVEHCSCVVDKLDACLSVLLSPGLPTQEKRMRWLDTARSEATSYSATLEVSKAAIGLALDLVGVYVLSNHLADLQRSPFTGPLCETRRLTRKTAT